MSSILTKQSRKPLALTVDDDPDFNKIMRLLLKRLGMDVKTTSSPTEFLTALKEHEPDLCLVDLNLGDLDVGFTIVQAVRKVMGPEMPLLIVSRSSDRQSIAHALELGANDFIVKPVDQELLATKLNRFIDTEELVDTSLEFVAVPIEESRAYVTLGVEVVEVDELGMKLLSPHLVSKGTAVYLDHPFIHQVTGKAHPVLANITSTWIEPEGAVCGAYAEFDDADDDLRASVRRWIAANVRTGGAKT